MVSLLFILGWVCNVLVVVLMFVIVSFMLVFFISLMFLL